MSARIGAGTFSRLFRNLGGDSFQRASENGVSLPQERGGSNEEKDGTGQDQGFCAAMCRAIASRQMPRCRPDGPRVRRERKAGAAVPAAPHPLPKQQGGLRLLEDVSGQRRTGSYFGGFASHAALARSKISSTDWPS